jgi:hypothetical protein
MAVKNLKQGPAMDTITFQIRINSPVHQPHQRSAVMGDRMQTFNELGGRNHLIEEPYLSKCELPRWLKQQPRPHGPSRGVRSMTVTDALPAPAGKPTPTRHAAPDDATRNCLPMSGDTLDTAYFHALV